MEALHYETCPRTMHIALFDVIVGSVLWQKVDILNMYGLKEV